MTPRSNAVVATITALAVTLVVSTFGGTSASSLSNDLLSVDADLEVGAASDRTSSVVPSSAPPDLGDVISTLVLMNGTLVPGNFLAANGESPEAIAVDTAHHRAYVANFDSSNLAVIDTTLQAVVAFVPVGLNPLAVAVDGTSGRVFVADSYENEVTVVDGTTLAVLRTVHVGDKPSAIAYDGADDHVYVANQDSANVTVFEGATGTVVANFGVGDQPTAAAYDATEGHVYVANIGSGTVSVIDTATLTVTDTVTVGSGPTGLAVNGLTGDVYVANAGAGNVTIFDGSSGAVVGNISGVPLPMSITFDSANGHLYTTGFAFNNVTILDPATETVVGSVHVGTYPLASAFDPGTGFIYVVNEYSQNLSVIDGTTDTVVGAIAVGVYPTGIAYNSVNGHLYVPAQTGGIVVVDGADETVLSTISVAAFLYPFAAVADTVNGHVYVANWVTSSLIVVDGATDTVLGSIPVGGLSHAVAFDANHEYIYVANWGGDNVTVINGADDSIVRSVPVGLYPRGVAYDPTNDHVYVSQWIAGDLTVFQGATGVVLGTVELGLGYFPGDLTFDPATNHLYVAVEGADRVGIVDTTTDTLVGSVDVGSEPIGVAVSGSNGLVYVANQYSDNVTVFDGETAQVVGSLAVGESPSAIAYDAASGHVLVTNEESGTVSIIGTAPTYAVTFTEEGLPSGTSWSVTMSGETKTSTSTTISFDEPNGQYPFAAGGADGYTPDPASGTVTVNGAAVGVSIAFEVATYGVTFTESGLPSGTEWSMTLDEVTHTSTTTVITFDEANGSHAYTAGTVAGYTAQPSSGTVVVDGVAVCVTITYAGAFYTVTFTAVGLPSGTAWAVVLGGVSHGSTTATVTFSEPDGSYAYTVAPASGYLPDPDSGTVVVSGGDAAASITFSEGPTYDVTFTASGLPAGTSWAVTLGGSTLSSTTASITFSEPDGVYAYSVAPVSGYDANPGTGTVTVSGEPASAAIAFTPGSNFVVTFTETGLPSGTSWSVTLAGDTHASSTGAITFSVPNGVYSFQVGAVSGYSSDPSSGTISVSGVAESEAIQFSEEPSVSAAGFLGMSGSTGYYVLGGIVGAVAMVAGVLVYLRLRGRPHPTRG